MKIYHKFDTLEEPLLDEHTAHCVHHGEERSHEAFQLSLWKLWGCLQDALLLGSMVCAAFREELSTSRKDKCRL